MRTEVIRYIVDVYKQHSINKVAAQNNISPQGLSKALRAVEEELSVKLFYKDSAGATPTGACEQLYPYFMDMLNIQNNMYSSIEAYKHCDQKVLTMIGRESGLAFRINKAIDDINLKGNVRIVFKSFNESEFILEKMFKSRNTDFYFCTQELLPYKEKRGEFLCSIPMGFVVDKHSPIANNENIDVSSICNYTVLAERLDSPHIELLKMWCEEKGFFPTILRVDDRLLIWEMLKEKSTYIHLCKKADYEKVQLLGFDNLKFIGLSPEMALTIVLRSRSYRADKEILKAFREALKDYPN